MEKRQETFEREVKIFSSPHSVVSLVRPFLNRVTPTTLDRHGAFALSRSTHCTQDKRQSKTHRVERMWLIRKMRGKDLSCAVKAKPLADAPKGGNFDQLATAGGCYRLGASTFHPKESPVDLHTHQVLIFGSVENGVMFFRSACAEKIC